MATHTGTVRQLEFIAEFGWCQATLDGDPGELVVTTSDARMQGVLEAAFITGAAAEVTYNERRNNVLMRVKVRRETSLRS
jgi:hypothetical protein